MYRTHTCGELRLSDTGKRVTLCGWVQRTRDLGGMTFIDLRDRYGITQLVFSMETNPELCEKARELGREYVVQVTGMVRERSNKNFRIPTGEIEIEAEGIKVLNSSELPPFTIEDDTDGGEELRMKFRYLDLRRPCLRDNILLRHRAAREVRKYLDSQGFIEIETPMLIKSTPEGARDFVVPSRLQPGMFYALPQSPQTFKQLLMVAGFDKYFQIVRCFRDEDLRADRQPEFTQIDCEMSFVEQNDVLETFEGLAKHLFREIKGVEFTEPFPRLSWKEAMERFGTDKPDMRFGMEIKDITCIVKGKGFGMFDNAEYVGGICAEGCSEYSRRQTDELTEFVKRPQIGAQGLVVIKYNSDGTVKSSLEKFYSNEELQGLMRHINATPGSLVLIIAGNREKTLAALSELRLEMGNRLGLRKSDTFCPLWVVDFPLLEWDEETKRFYARHHPFTSPKPEDIDLLESAPAEVRANAYDLVINGIEIGGGSIRIHDSATQKLLFKVLGFTEEEAVSQFGFLINAFRYGAPPHGGIAFGFDRWVALLAGEESIRDVIAFPKNNSGRDIMIDTPSPISQQQLDELLIEIKRRNSQY
ncbi:MAG TPA: aspartate--tRNA ligase [Bacteroidales bacterium]|nr:aspartate--tRNA ligase [Bacteroidales bacterium]HOK75278.1 aspartate--tRNA ligase [Bacteroidales bacterium]HOM39770.1 aspartate--tRNA ligase [Bacteroidales bacterium]HPP91326.1 aspartate--tRNA ligase [Bacteroidales bacterium]HQG56413.1 aspartate--tRNA ligase [Bacteroidales bacterium]